MQVNAERPGNVWGTIPCGNFFPLGVCRRELRRFVCELPHTHVVVCTPKIWQVVLQSLNTAPPIALRGVGAGPADMPGIRTAHTHRKAEHPPTTRVYCSTMPGSVRQRGKWKRRMHKKCTRNKCADKAAEQNRIKHREKKHAAKETGMSIELASNGLQYMGSVTHPTPPSWLCPGSLASGDDLTSQRRQRDGLDSTQARRLSATMCVREHGIGGSRHRIRSAHRPVASTIRCVSTSACAMPPWLLAAPASSNDSMRTRHVDRKRA